MATVPRHTNRFNSSTKILAAVVCLALLVSMTPLVAARNGQAGTWSWPALFLQGHGNGPRREAPAGVFPNMDEMRLRTDEARRYGAEAPTIPAPIPSTRRRWRREPRAAAQAQPLRKVEVDFNALLAFASPPSDTGISWLTSQDSESISRASVGLSFSSANSYEPGHKGPIETAWMASPVLMPQSPSNFAMARIAPENRTGTPGVDLLSKNFNWSLGVVGLRGRSGLDLGLSLAYNSKVWTKTGNYIDFDLDEGTPAPGFRLGFPVVQGLYYNDQATAYFYMLITPAGQRIELRRLGTSNVYQTVDATYAQLTDYGSYLMFRADGAQLKFDLLSGEYRCTEVKDRNGNYLTIAYNASNDISTVTDTLARVINFNYDGNANLISITQSWAGQTHTWATFGYGVRYVGNNFPSLVSYGPFNEYINALTQVGLPDGSRYNFEYNNYYGMVSEIRHHAYDGHERRRTTLSLDGSSTDCPKVLTQREWAENWNGDVNGVHATNEEAVTNFGVDGSACTMTLPNGVIYKEFYGTGWQAGLPTQTETWSAGVRKKWTTYAWTQDNVGVSYLLNPRLIETNVNDVEGNRKRVTISYSHPAYAPYSLPYEVIEYANDGVTMLRRTYTDYNVSSTYTDRRIIGLVIAVHVVDHASGAYASKTTFDYDWGGEYLAGLSPAPIRHDGANYGAGFVSGRGNVSSVWRWDVTDINNGSKAIAVRRTGYNITGAAAFVRDALGHQTSIAYTDSYSDSVNRNTYTYPTTLTDADNYQATTQYNFDLGAVTRTQGPPAGQSQGAITTMTYDAAGRIQWLNNVNNGAWKFFAYADRGDAVMSQETITAAPASYWKITVVDGANRVRLVGGDHPGSSGTYAGAFTYYDVMGRVSQHSNPAETNAYWSPTGDDSAGWFFTQQTYDWQGRPLVTTNPDGTTKEASYGGCGCAGGQVVTMIDEGTLDGGAPKRREQKIYSDVLGRTVKTEVRNWQGGSVYSATVNTYNARDQITRVRQYAGAEGAGTYQDTDITFDGYGRVKTKHMPEQAAGTATTWDYNSDDTVQKVTDARGASQTFVYNNRHLVTGISYDVPGGSTIPIPASVGYAYDAAGNRTSMTDGMGSISYVYDSLSRLTSETRVFTGVGTYSLSYGYNLAGAVTSITDPFGAQVGYVYDSVGRVTSVTGANFGGISSYASDFHYRASGALKDLDYGNGRTLSLTYNSRLQPASFTVPGVMNKTYDYYSDGRLKFSHDLMNPVFDRSYAHDHASRLKEALSGAEARNEGTTSNRPYQQTFVYDTFGHLTQRPVNQIWTEEGEGFSPAQHTYVNERNTNWSYDTDGNLTDSSSVDYTIDAAGETQRFISLTPIEPPPGQPIEEYAVTLDVTQSFDGNGMVIKKIAANTVHGSQGGDQTTTHTTYLLRSTVLGGKVMAEIGSESDQRGFVYLGSAVLAVQSRPSQTVFWEHRDVGNGSLRLTSSNGTVTTAGSAELDPLGGDAGLSAPVTETPSPAQYWKFSSYPGVGSAKSSNTCIVDYIMRPCDLALEKTSIDSCPENGCGPQIFIDSNGKEHIVPLTRNPDTGSLSYRISVTYLVYDEFWEDENKKYKKKSADVYVDGVPQKPNREVIGMVDAILANDKCFDFLKTVLNKAATKGNPVLRGGNIREIFSDFLAQAEGGLVRGSLPGARYGSASGRIGSGGKGNGRIYRGYSTGDQNEYDARGILNELPHLAGSAGGWPQRNEYDDLSLARATHDSGYNRYFRFSSVPNPFSTFPDRKSQERNRYSNVWSSYFHDILQQHCLE